MIHSILVNIELELLIVSDATICSKKESWWWCSDPTAWAFKPAFGSELLAVELICSTRFPLIAVYGSTDCLHPKAQFFESLIGICWA